MDRVVDTNVAVVANGRDVTASADCQISSIELLEDLLERGRILIDVPGDILSEYQKRLHAEGQPGVGDLFFRHVLDNQGNAKRIRTVDTHSARTAPLRDAIAHGGLAKFDPSDRPFALCAVAGRSAVAVATDSDWTEHEAGLQACGVRVHYVCGRPAATRS